MGHTFSTPYIVNRVTNTYHENPGTLNSSSLTAPRAIWTEGYNSSTTKVINL